MVILLGDEVAESAVLRNWALAECSSPERWSKHGLVVQQHVVQQLPDGSHVDEHEWSELENAMRRFRGPLLEACRLRAFPVRYSLAHSERSRDRG